MLPRDPIAAVTHPDPYAYYADLMERAPLYHDETLGLWVAANAAAVEKVLTDSRCRVRPPAEPVPAALRGTAAGDIFGRLVRMNDGPDHDPLKRAIAAALGQIDAARMAGASAACAGILAREIAPDDPRTVSDFAFRLPVYVVAHLLGVPRDDRRQTARWIGDFARCLAPSGSPGRVGPGVAAARALIDLVRPLLAAQVAGRADGLLGALAREVGRVGRDDADVVVANGIGLLFQAYEATAGLIGNALVALAAHPGARRRFAADLGSVRDVMLEALRHDPPIQNTRRFLAEDGMVAGQAMARGDGVLVVLAAANRDPAANPSPHAFDLDRRDRRSFAFGHGGHGCPGQSLALTIARAGVAAALASGVDPAALAGAGGVTYRASANTRIPLFTRATDPER